MCSMTWTNYTATESSQTLNFTENFDNRRNKIFPTWPTRLLITVAHNTTTHLFKQFMLQRLHGRLCCTSVGRGYRHQITTVRGRHLGLSVGHRRRHSGCAQLCGMLLLQLLDLLLLLLLDRGRPNRCAAHRWLLLFT